MGKRRLSRFLFGDECLLLWAKASTLVALTFFILTQVPSNLAGGVLGPVRCSNNLAQFEIGGQSGKMYRIDYSFDLVAWETVGGVIATNYPISFSVTNIHSVNRVFFRAVEVTPETNYSSPGGITISMTSATTGGVSVVTIPPPSEVPITGGTGTGGY